MTDPVSFDAIEAKFDWTNDDWALAHLPWVRTASIMVQKNQEELKGCLAGMVSEGIAPGTLDALCDSRDHLRALAQLLDAALARSFVVLDQLGYSPDCPPPGANDSALMH